MLGRKGRSLKRRSIQHKKKHRRRHKTKYKIQKGNGGERLKQRKTSDLYQTVDALKFLMEQNIPNVSLRDAVLLSSDEDLKKYDPASAEKIRAMRREIQADGARPTTRPGQGGTKRRKTKKKTRKKTRKKK